MSDNSRIEWTDASWNPVTGCTKVSPGCDHCYAERDFNRFNGPGAFDTVRLMPNRLVTPLKWRKPRRIFVNSMSDLFHDDVPDEYIAKVFAVMDAAPRHTFQLLTKRHGRLRSLLSSSEFLAILDDARVALTPGCGDFVWPLPNVWLGVSVENQQWADIRIPVLLDTPAVVRFLSCEPLIGPVDLTRIPAGFIGGTGVPATRSALRSPCAECGGWGVDPCALDGPHFVNRGGVDPCIDWVIVGGESGHGARAMDIGWVRTIRDDCYQADVPFFMKQAGAVLAGKWGCTDRKGHNPHEWPDEFPRQMPDRQAVPE